MYSDVIDVLTHTTLPTWSNKNGNEKKKVTIQKTHSRIYGESDLTVALRLIPTVLARTAHECCARTKMPQKSAVTKVLPASDHRRPRAELTRYAPSCKPNISC